MLQEKLIEFFYDQIAALRLWVSVGGFAGSDHLPNNHMLISCCTQESGTEHLMLFILCSASILISRCRQSVALQQNSILVFVVVVHCACIWVLILCHSHNLCVYYWMETRRNKKIMLESINKAIWATTLEALPGLTILMRF